MLYSFCQDYGVPFRRWGGREGGTEEIRREGKLDCYAHTPILSTAFTHRCGKLIVATSDDGDEVQRLEVRDVAIPPSLPPSTCPLTPPFLLSLPQTLYQQALRNGVNDLRRLSSHDVAKMEPHVHCTQVGTALPSLPPSLPPILPPSLPPSFLAGLPIVSASSSPSFCQTPISPYFPKCGKLTPPSLLPSLLPSLPSSLPTYRA